MIGLLATFLINRGVAARFARPAIFAGLFVLAISATIIGKVIYDRTLIRQHDAEVTAETVRQDSAAKEQAATERTTDTATISKAQEERNHAINNGQPNKPSAASIRHNCERLRKAGADTSRIPQCN